MKNPIARTTVGRLSARDRPQQKLLHVVTPCELAPMPLLDWVE
jgi:hypothetical protein